MLNTLSLSLEACSTQEGHCRAGMLPVWFNRLKHIVSLIDCERDRIEQRRAEGRRRKGSPA